MLPGVQALEAHQHILFRHLKNEFFSKNLGLVFLKLPPSGCVGLATALTVMRGSD